MPPDSFIARGQAAATAVVTLLLLASVVAAQPAETPVLGVNPTKTVARLAAVPDLQPGRRVQFVRGADRQEVGQGVVARVNEHGTLVRLRQGGAVGEGDLAVFCPARGEVDTRGQELRGLVAKLREQATQTGTERLRTLANQLQTALDARSGALRRGACDTQMYDAQIAGVVRDFQAGTPGASQATTSQAPPAPPAPASPAPEAAAPAPAAPLASAPSGTTDVAAAPPAPPAEATPPAPPSATESASATPPGSGTPGAGDIIQKLIDAMSGLAGKTGGGSGGSDMAPSPVAAAPAPIATPPPAVQPPPAALAPGATTPGPTPAPSPAPGPGSSTTPPTSPAPGTSTTPPPSPAPGTGSTKAPATPPAVAPTAPPKTGLVPNPHFKMPIKPGALSAGMALTGRVRDDRGQPVPNAQVVVDDARSVRTDASGTFTVANLGPGTHRLALSASGFLPASRTVMLDPAHPATMEITLHRPPAAIRPPGPVVTPVLPHHAPTSEHRAGGKP